MTYTYARGTDGCDSTFDIFTPEGVFLTAIHFWDEAERAEKDAKMIVDALNAYTPKQPMASELLETLKAALNNGSNFWNGADFYGPPNSNSLQLLHHYFTKYPEDKEKVALCMKGAFTFDPLGPDNSPASIRKSIDTCLHVLDDKVFIDVWEPARADPKVPIETTIETIAEYVKAGKIGGIGLSECNANTIRRAHAVHPISVVEVEMSLFTTDAYVQSQRSCCMDQGTDFGHQRLTNDVALTCAELGITLLAYAPLSHGFLTGQIKKFEDFPENDMRRAIPRFQPDVFYQNMKLVDEVRKVAERKGCTVSISHSTMAKLKTSAFSVYSLVFMISGASHLGLPII